MRISRPRAGWVAALLLLWQFGSLVTAVGPAAAALGMGASATAAVAHCHGDTATSGSRALHLEHHQHDQHHDGAPPCCELAGACGCACAQAPAFLDSIAVAIALPRTGFARSLLESTPLAERPTELFRPPI